jgi:hypothetical protein
MRNQHITAMTLALFLVACGGGGGDSGSNSGGTATPVRGGESAAATPPPAAESDTRQTSSSSLYEREPLIESCDPGILKSAEKQLALRTLNEMRAAHGLPTVSYDATDDLYTRQAALIGLVNKALSHYPTAQWRCFSGDALAGAQSSNLYLRWGIGESDVSTPSTLASLLIDEGVAALGHRRWMLSPFLATTSFGRVDGFPGEQYVGYTSVALKVTGALATASTDTPAAQRGFVAYPDGDYPGAWFKHGASMSFSVFANPTSVSANDARAVSFSDAVVEIRDANGQLLVLTERADDYVAYGLPNTLMWRTLETRTGARYSVSITNVSVNGVRRNYNYSFRIKP